MKYGLFILLGLLLFMRSLGQNLFLFEDHGLWGYKDVQGNTKIPPQYKYAGRFRMGIAVVSMGDSVGAINENNQLIIPYKYHFLQALDSSEILFGYRADYLGEYNKGVMNRNQQVKIPAEYRFITKHNGCYIVTQNQDSIIGKMGPSDVRSIKSFYGLLDSNGKLLIPCIYEYIDWKNDSLVQVTKHGGEVHMALFNKNGIQLTSFDYMVFGKFTEGLAKARVGNKFGYVDGHGKLLIPIVFDYCEDFENGSAIIQQKGKWGAIDKKGKIIIQPKYDYQEIRKKLSRDELVPRETKLNHKPGNPILNQIPHEFA
jgi:WG containing repeat